ncbi:ABC transporter ATP-binding protein [Candidatus Galacturonibacter soehngenii]|uniref:ABC transporter ATP-binding protein n=1 Tax=Candidatus Galacturonatibacter soehngenii TaxID=2307010 RepID=A0A7V7UHJ9_9FIRM|nr:ABC transporter ATP-binding protein [Candidatus Galacturonibacter soehngenii]KAB1440053.1 ABC transporter ATP-binding protein [Candidatus Galacturonibacter soehngenii]
MKKISSYILEHWYFYFIAIICMVFQVGLDMLSPQLTKKIIDDVIGNGQIGILTQLLLMIFLIGAGRCVFGYIKEYIFDKISASIASDMRKRLFHHIQGLSIGFFNENNTGEIMARVKDDVDKIWSALGYISMLIIEVVIHTTIILFCMFHLNFKLFMIPVIAMPVVGFLAILMENKLGGVYEEISEENAVLNTVAQENLAGVRTVKAFAREKFEITKFLSHNKRYYDLNMRQSKVLVKYQPMFQMITKLLPIVAIVYGGVLVINGEITLGTLGAAAEYCNNIVWPMEMLGWLFNDLASAIASNKKIKTIYNQKPQIVEEENPITLGEVKGNVKFEQVSLQIDKKYILKDISFEVEAGKTIGIMGATGTGKTSIINLLQRFYDVSEGKILLDGVDIRKLSLKELRKNITLVMQDVFLFSDTINSNVKLGKKNRVRNDEVREALRESHATNFIEKMENQYETLIGERGVGLSGGQKQRISIARALAKRMPILVLDDSTSALDMETEYKIQNNLNELDNVTKIIIAHRISAVRNADEIIVLEKGKIAERGKHDELLAMKGLYYKTFHAQYKEVMRA